MGKGPYLLDPDQMSSEERLAWLVETMGEALLKCVLEDRRRPVPQAEEKPRDALIEPPGEGTVSIE